MAENDKAYEALLNNPGYKLWGGLRTRLQILYETGIPSDMRLGITDSPPTEEVGLCQLIVAWDLLRDLRSSEQGVREKALTILGGEEKLNVRDLTERAGLVIGREIGELFAKYELKRDK